VLYPRRWNSSFSRRTGTINIQSRLQRLRGKMVNTFEGFSTFDAEVRKLLKQLTKTNKDNDGNEDSKQTRKVVFRNAA
jgi:hypothetical protein